jgi:dipeptidyl aminopeptidase/acylaminoacyl peptidase
MTIRAPFGSWTSPITASMVARGGMSARGTLSDLTVEGSTVYWITLRPDEDGRYVITRLAPHAEPEDITPQGFNVRTLVHEYGGGSFCVHEGVVFFSNLSDQRVYRQDPGTPPHPISPEPVIPRGLRYADGCVTPDGTRLFLVREMHETDGEVTNEIISLPTDGEGQPEVVASGHDFFASPRVDREGQQLAWLAWDHPQMPWDGTELWTAAIDADGQLVSAKRLAGGTQESILQPEWSPEGRLHFVSDRSGWWNLYRWSSGQPESLAAMEAEFASPAWAFGRSHYDFLSDNRIIVAYGRKGIDHLGLIESGAGEVTPIPFEFTALHSAHLRTDGAQRAWFIGSSPAQAQSVIRFDVQSGSFETLVESVHRTFPEGYVSHPETIEFPTSGGDTAFALYYPPANPEFDGPEGTLPPLIVHSHGGPTSAAQAQFHLETLYWTSRGFGLVDVNYRGSTGYGRAYRDRLKGFWGIVDIDDCLNAARYLAQQGRIDPHRKAISGGSAGGYVTLCALTFHDIFEAGASYYGVADAEALVTDTHKFESHYFDTLIGPYPEAQDLYRERSPIHFVEQLSAPLIIFQGLEDKIVPPNQAEAIVKALDGQKIPYAYLAFEGEQHGFRKLPNIVRSLEAELSFYGRVFGFTPAGNLPKIEIHHMD